MGAATFFLTGILAGALITLVSKSIMDELSEKETRLAKVEKEIQRIKKNKRQTQNTDAALLDAMATIIDLEFNNDEMEARVKTNKMKIEKAREILGVARKGPYEYPKDLEES